MKYPQLPIRQQKEIRIDRFLGLDRSVGAPDGSFADLRDLTGDGYPALRVQPASALAVSVDGNPADRVLAMADRGVPVLVCADGSIRCGGHILRRLLPHTIRLTLSCPGQPAPTLVDRDAVLSALADVDDGYYYFVFERFWDRWVREDGQAEFPGPAVICDQQPDDGDRLTVRLQTFLRSDAARDLVLMGGWACVFPDGCYVNTVKLRQGAELEEGVDYGLIEQDNACDRGALRFTPCAADGTELTVTCSDTAPASGLWVDTSEPEPRLLSFSQSQNAWVETLPYVKCLIPGIAKGISAGDGVELTSRCQTGQHGEAEVTALWTGTHVLVGAFHDPGDANRDEGAGDYVILAGMLPGEVELELSWHDQYYFSLRRPLPEMDFVVEAQNRLWGCRWGHGVNELYGSKLGDFRNWAVFDGLSTDSYRVSRGQDGPFTGAAVLDGHPLFFRENSLEKIYPAADGGHGVVTVSLSGICPGSARSAVAVQGCLYYHSREGILRYDGTLPVCVSKALGRTAWTGAVAGTRSGKYYVSLTDPAGETSICVFDPRTSLWYRQSGRFVICCGAGERLWWTEQAGGPLYCEAPGQSCAGVSWYAESGPLGPALRTKRYISRLQLTACLEDGASMTVYLSYDGGPWQEAGSFTALRQEEKVYPIYPRRAGSVRLRLEGEGGMELRRLSWLLESGSDVM